jgi:hypothetical protein
VYVCACLYLSVCVYLCFHVNVASQGQNGILAGDETDWETLHIKRDALQSDFMLLPAP